MALSAWEASAREAAAYFAPPDSGPPPERFDTPGALAMRLDASIVQTPALALVDEFLLDVLNTPDGRGALNTPPQEGKTERIKALVLMALRDNPQTRIAIASADAGLARKMGRGIRDMIVMHKSLSLRLRADVKSQSEWQILGARGGVYTVGIGGSLSGRPVDLLIIDDPIVSTEQADSEAHRERVWDWWQSVGSTRLSPGASVILVQTRWHEDDLTGRVLHSEDAARWRHLSIPAQADHDPAKDQSDPLGRQPGEFLLSARGRTVAQWEAIRREKGSRTWNALYQGRPSPAEGGILQRSWFEDHWYDSAQWFESEGVRWVPWGDEVQLVQSWDFAFKATNSSDFVCGQVWLRRGVECWLLDQIHGRLDFVQSMAAIEALSARWPQCQAKFVEEAANGFAVIAALQQKIPGLLAVRPEGSKVARASAVSHLLEAGNVHVPHPQVGAWVTDLIEEAAAFPNGAHDDRVDAMSQALSRLMLDPFRPPETFQADEFDEVDLRGYAISPY